MKKKIIVHLFCITGFVFFLLLAIHNFKKDPCDNISLFSICFFSAMITVNLYNISNLFLKRAKDKQYQ